MATKRKPKNGEDVTGSGWTEFIPVKTSKGGKMVNSKDEIIRHTTDTSGYYTDAHSKNRGSKTTETYIRRGPRRHIREAGSAGPRGLYSANDTSQEVVLIPYKGGGKAKEGVGKSKGKSRPEKVVQTVADAFKKAKRGK